jgi:hypothetical protein
MPEMQANLLARGSLDENQKNPRHCKREPEKADAESDINLHSQVLIGERRKQNKQ